MASPFRGPFTPPQSPSASSDCRSIRRDDRQDQTDSPILSSSISYRKVDGDERELRYTVRSNSLRRTLGGSAGLYTSQGLDDEDNCCFGDDDPDGRQPCCKCHGCCNCGFWDRVQECCAPAQLVCSRRTPLYDSGEVVARGTDGRKVDAYTKGLVIVNRRSFPEHLFQQIGFSNPEQHGRLVHEVEYRKHSGTVHYDIESQDDLENDGYARLITLNWWYMQLLQSLVLACVSISNFFSNVLFSIGLFSDGHLRLTVPLQTRVVFVVLFFATELAIIRKCWAEVGKERGRKSDPTNQGDLIVGDSLNAIDNVACWVAMLCFKFIHVDTIVRDIIIHLHPWKSVQPYGAFKADGRRAFLVGWASEYMFRCENKQGQEELLAHHMFLIGVMSTFKVNVILESGVFAVAPLALLLPSLINFFVVMVKQWLLLHDRQKHWLWLCIQHEQSSRDMSEQSSRALEKQKSVHFPNTDWGSPLHEVRAFAVRTTFSVLIPAVLGVLMHMYDGSLHILRRDLAVASGSHVPSG